MIKILLLIAALDQTAPAKTALDANERVVTMCFTAGVGKICIPVQGEITHLGQDRDPRDRQYLAGPPIFGTVGGLFGCEAFHVDVDPDGNVLATCVKH